MPPPPMPRAKPLTQQRIVLIDGERLAGCSSSTRWACARRTYVLRSVDEDYFIEA